MGEAFYGRAQAYRAALAADLRPGVDRGLGPQHLRRRGRTDAASRLAAYMRVAVRDLAAAAGRAAGRRDGAFPRSCNGCAGGAEEFEFDEETWTALERAGGRGGNPGQRPASCHRGAGRGAHGPRWTGGSARFAALCGRIRSHPPRRRRPCQRAGQAQVGQTCVVSLEPIENAVDETVDVLFAPGTAAGGDELAAEPGIDGRDPPEPLVDGIIDLGALATEFLLLGVDPYPRKAGAEFAAAQGGGCRRAPVCCAGSAEKAPGAGRERPDSPDRREAGLSGCPERLCSPV